MNEATIRERIGKIQKSREVLVKLLDKPDLGTLSLDVNQALEELDELILEFQQTFPEEEVNN